MILYLDTSAIIYGLEGDSRFREQVIRIISKEGVVLVTSRISRLECRTKPMRDEDGELLALYDQFFTRATLALVDVTEAVIERATEMRAKYNFRTPDALHVASALERNCELFVTGDQKLNRCREIQVELIQLV